MPFHIAGVDGERTWQHSDGETEFAIGPVVVFRGVCDEQFGLADVFSVNNVLVQRDNPGVCGSSLPDHLVIQGDNQFGGQTVVKLGSQFCRNDQVA